MALSPTSSRLTPRNDRSTPNSLTPECLSNTPLTVLIIFYDWLISMIFSTYSRSQRWSRRKIRGSEMNLLNPSLLITDNHLSCHNCFRPSRPRRSLRCFPSLQIKTRSGAVITPGSLMSPCKNAVRTSISLIWNPCCKESAIAIRIELKCTTGANFSRHILAYIP